MQIRPRQLPPSHTVKKSRKSSTFAYIPFSGRKITFRKVENKILVYHLPPNVGILSVL